MIIDLNADLGEGGSNDEALLQLVTSANIASGFHAGDAQTMRLSVRWGMRYGVSLGAHPSFLDRENFGRKAMSVSPDTVFAQVVYQLGALSAIVVVEGGRLTHVKPHGMLHNQTARDPMLADTACLHGDGDHALLFALKLRQCFNEHQIQVRAT